MGWPADDLDTSNMDAGTDSPALARPMLVRLLNRVKTIIAARGVANGIASLDRNGKIPSIQVPETEAALWTPSGAYQEIGLGASAVLPLAAPASESDLLVVGFDQYRESYTEGSGQDAQTHMEVPWRRWAAYTIFYRRSLPTTNATLTYLGPALQCTLTLTTDRSITVAVSEHWKMRIYGIRGRAA